MNERYSKTQEKFSDGSNVTERAQDVYKKTEVEQRPLRAPPATHPPRGRSAQKAKPVPIRTQDSGQPQQTSQDVEKGSRGRQSTYTQRSQMSPYQNTARSYTGDEYDEDEEDDSHEPKRHAVWILVSLLNSHSCFSRNSLIDNNRSTCPASLLSCPSQ